MITQAQIDACVEVAKKYGATRVLLFGSAKDDPARARDIDLICEGVTGMEFFGMVDAMECESRADVDVVPGSPESRFCEIASKYGKVLYAVATPA